MRRRGADVEIRLAYKIQFGAEGTTVVQDPRDWRSADHVCEIGQVAARLLYRLRQAILLWHRSDTSTPRLGARLGVPHHAESLRVFA
jgi:hypothetical protein